MAETLEARLIALKPGEPGLREAIARARADLAAFRFHLHHPGTPALLVIVGGTGTGKSTLLNRLLGERVSATSYRRTFTAGPIAVQLGAAQAPEGWLGVEHVIAQELPARGHPDALVIVKADGWRTAASSETAAAAPAVLLVDTPDLDGDQPAHHMAADRAFRWATGVIFVVTPEKYQMTELLSYYRLARRYGIQAWFVMNKAEQREVVEDYARQLAAHDWPDAALFVIERDDSAFAPEPSQSIEALRKILLSIGDTTASTTDGPTAGVPTAGAARAVGLAARQQDLVNRLVDQVLAPLRDQRSEIERTIRALQALEEPTTTIDVNPLTEQLRVRLQQRSILYLMGPQRVWHRVRQAPGLLLRLPRSMWSMARGRKLSLPEPDPLPTTDTQAPDFVAALRDQFIVVQSRIEDLLRANPRIAQWMEPATANTTDTAQAPGEDPAGEGVPHSPYAECRIDPAEAGRIAEEEIAALRAWLEQRWNANPRDTRLVMKILRYLPGGQRVIRAVEAAPYLYLLILIIHPAQVLYDVALGAGYFAVTHLIERLSNEVLSRARATNRRIADRFADLAHRQIQRTIDWLNTCAPGTEELAALERAINRFADERV